MQVLHWAQSGELTLWLAMEVVVVLGDVGDDREFVRHLDGHHVRRLQERWDAQLLLRHLERLHGIDDKFEMLSVIFETEF